MASESAIIARVRRELGDLGEPFQSSIRSDGETIRYDLPTGLVDAASLTILLIPPTGPMVQLPSNAYSLTGNVLTLSSAPADGTNIVVQGTSFAMFTDAELQQYARDALLQHLEGREDIIRYRDDHGFIKLSKTQMLAAQLPDIEEYPVALLATVMALWTLATDAATDIDVFSGEGTVIPRRQRFAQVRSQIEALTARYQEIATALNVGIHRIEVSTLRRVSRTTNRYVPIYVPREYDDHTWPTRIIPPTDHRYEDESGLPSPNYGNEPW